MTTTHLALIVTHAVFVVAAAVMLVELVRLRRTAWRLLRDVHRRDRRRSHR